MAATREQIEIETLRAEVNKIIAETAEINQRTRWYVPIVTAAAVAGLLTAGKVFF